VCTGNAHRGFDAVAPARGKKAYQRIQALDWDDAQDYPVYTSAVIAAEQGASAGHGPDLLHRRPSSLRTGRLSGCELALGWALSDVDHRAEQSSRRLAADPVSRRSS